MKRSNHPMSNDKNGKLLLSAISNPKLCVDAWKGIETKDLEKQLPKNNVPSNPNTSKHPDTKRDPNGSDDVCSRCGHKQVRAVYTHRESKGERKVRLWLEAQGITHTRNHRIPELKNHPYDFYLPKSRTLIEYDGKHHFERCPDIHNERSFDEFKRINRIKMLRALTNGYKLVRIDYKSFNRIEQHLELSLIRAAPLYLSSCIYESV